jgi:hypothetical protein
MNKDNSNTNKDETYEKESNKKITFYVSPEFWNELKEESKNYSSIGQFCKTLVIQRHDHKNKNNDDF